MKNRTPVSKIMSSNVMTVNTTNKLEDAHNIMTEHNVHHVPVVSGKTVIGILSKSDIDRISFLVGIEKEKAITTVFDILTIEQVMTKEVKSVEKNSTIKESLEIFADAKFHALPVVDGGDLVGIVTSTDVFKYMLEQY